MYDTCQSSYGTLAMHTGSLPLCATQTLFWPLIRFPAHVAAHLLRKPFFVKIVGDYAWEQGVQRYGITDTLDTFNARTEFPFKVRMLRHIETHVAKTATHVVVPSEYLKHVVLAWGVPESQISVVYNSPPLPLSYVKGDRMIEEKYVITIARLVPWKGINSVIRAMKELETLARGMKLVIVGDGPERPLLEALADELDLRESITFTGNISHEETLKYLAHADAFLLNTKYEGLSHAILEAFALRIPVLTTRAGGNPELVEDGVTGLLFEEDDIAMMAQSVIRVQDSESLKSFLTTHARVRLEDFSQEAMLEGIRAVLTSS
jgi:glycosyltransferase involved in cell wall biosynthesis